MKLQQAYISESATFIGSWALIGYKAPGSTGTDAGATTNFSYAPASGAPTGANSTALATGVTGAWTATNNAKLNDCPSAANWTVSVSASSAGVAGEATYTAAFKADNKAACQPLTPSFETISQ